VAHRRSLNGVELTSSKSLDNDVWVISSQRAKIVAIAGHDETSPEPDCGRHDRRVNRVTGVQVVPAEQPARNPSSPMVKLDDAVASTHHTINARSATSPPKHHGQHRGSNANPRVPPRRLRQDRLHAPSRDRPLTW
jgi:hypothetical protein